MANNKTGMLILILVIVVLILSGVIVYAFVVKPALLNYQIQKQNEGINYALVTIVQQIQTRGYAEIPVGNETLVLVPLQQQVVNSETLTPS